MHDKMAFTYCYKAFIMEDKISEIKEQIKELGLIFDYPYLSKEQYEEIVLKINNLKLELEQLENGL